MIKKLFIIIITCIIIKPTNVVLATEMQPGEFLVLCYHNVPVQASPGDPFGISQNIFIEQMEYLRTHEYNFISLEDVLAAYEGRKELPKNPVLLTFDDCYISYYEIVFPILKKFGYPSVLSLVGSWIDNPPDGLPEPLMSWEQIREVAQCSLVEIASHSYDLHKGVQYNPWGNVGPSLSVRGYDSKTETYETEEEYINRIMIDFIVQKDLIEKQLRFIPRAMVWPYGWYSQISIAAAQNEGYRFCFTVEDGFAHVDRPNTINRSVVMNRPFKEFITAAAGTIDTFVIRAVQVDLDLVYDPNSQEQTYQNLSKLIDRLVAMKVNTVYLQAFSDPDGSGNIKSVYFPNRVLPMRSDLFSYAVHQMRIRNMKVYAWMPTLSIVLPDSELNDSLRVHEYDDGNTEHRQSWYKRLTPFSSKVREFVRTLYEDISVHSQIDGVLFQDDAYLTEKEDYHSSALASYRTVFGKDITPDVLEEDPELAMDWARYKTEVLIDFTKTLMEEVRKYRPSALFARNLYAAVLIDPQSEKWFAQNYKLFLEEYDQVVIMAYPQMEGVGRPLEWLRHMVDDVKRYPKGIEKTVFKVQVYDWKRNTWIEDDLLLKEMRDILAQGGKHIAYYPDGVWKDKPTLKKIMLEMSTKSYPFMP